MLKKVLCAALALLLCLPGLALADESALLDAYDLISPLGNGFYAVRRDGLWGIASESGELALAPRLDSEPAFEAGFAVVSSRGDGPRMLDAGSNYPASRCGVIDERGAIRIPFAYDSIQLSDGIALAHDANGERYLDLNGEPLATADYDGLSPFVGGYAVVSRDSGEGWYSGVIDKTGAEVVPLEFSEILLSADGGPAAARATGRDPLYGFIDMTGAYVIEPGYDAASPFSGGCAAVSVRTGEIVKDASGGAAYESRWGLIDEAGGELLPPKYDYVQVDADGNIEAQDGGASRWFKLRDGALEEIEAPSQQPFAEPLASARPARGHAGGGALFVERRDGRWLLTDASGAPAREERFLNEPVFENGFAAVSVRTGEVTEGFSGEPVFDTRWGLIDESGRTRIPLEYDELRLSEGIALAREGEEYRFLDTDGQPIAQARYYRAEPFRNGYAAVGVKYETGEFESTPYSALWGVIDRSGAEVVPCKFEGMELGDGDTAVVEIWESQGSGGYDFAEGYIDMNGEFLFEALFDDARPFVGDYAVVALKVETARADADSDSVPVSNDWGVIDRSGKPVLPLQYDAIDVFEGGLYRATQGAETHWFQLKGGKAEEIKAPM